jgi:hypothetical protein
MDIGMLWYDDDGKRPLDEKVARAAAYYRAKYGVQPTECYVNPGTLAPDAPSPAVRWAGSAGMLGEGQPRSSAGWIVAAGVRLRPNRTILKNHFWLGIGEGSETGPARKVKA